MSFIDEKSVFLSYAYDSIKELAPPGSNVLEFGSGSSSKELVDLGYNVTAVEHDPEWMNRYEGVNYIHAPIVDLPYSRFINTYFNLYKTWYDMDKILPCIKDKKFDLILIDGPPAHIGRAGFFLYIELFKGIPIVMDDVQRDVEQRLFFSLTRVIQTQGLILPVSNGIAAIGVIAEPSRLFMVLDKLKEKQ